MISKIKKLYRMELLQVGSLNAIAVVVKMASIFGINKILAIYVGTSGYALIGQFQNIIQVITMIGGSAINTGVTKYTAEYDGDTKKLATLWSTSSLISVISATLTAISCLIFRDELSILVLNDESYSDIFIWISFGIIFIILNGLLLAIINGKRNIRQYVIANIIGSIISLIFTLYLSSKSGLWGALISLSIYQSFAFLSTLGILYKIFTSALTLYYIPRYSSLQRANEIIREFKVGYIVILPIVIFTTTLVYYFRDGLINLLFTSEFLPMRELFLAFMIGDVLKIGSWILSYFILSKAMMREFIQLEAIFSISYVIINIVFIEMYGLIGAGFAYAVNYAIYLLVLHIVVMRKARNYEV